MKGVDFMEKFKVYHIAVCSKIEQDRLGLVDTGCLTNVGFYRNKNTAFSAVKENWGDIHETCYDFAIIEEVEEGLYPCSTVRWIFHWIQSKQAYVQIEEPEWLRHFCGLVI